MDIDIQVVAESLWQGRRRGVYPEEWQGRLTLEVAYRVQLALLDRYLASGERRAGWKVGLTAPAIQRQVGIHEPVFGFLLESGAAASGVAFPFAGLIHPAVENELCLTIGRALAGPGLTLDVVRSAVSAVAPALEIVERRGDPAADVPLSIADNCQQRAFVVGPAAGPPAVSGDPAAATVEVYLNGRLAERASGTEVMGTPLASVAWLAERLSQFGRRIEPGMRVMSGSFTRQCFVDEPGIHIEARFTPYGSVVAQFT
jgi:2-keto-4-pentenoate hydratase